MRSEREPESALPQKRRRLWRWTKRLLKGLIGLILVLLLLGASYQFVATKLDERKYPPPGTLVDVGGYRLHLNCTREGTPTVVMDAGLGGGSLDWSTVQPEVAKFARVCSYDRAGIAWSDAGPQPRTSQQIVKELNALLGHAGVQVPYVLVAHSLGGINMQLYANQYPNEVAGMVLVDSSHENQFSRKDLPQIPSFLPLLIKALMPFGVMRIINKVAEPPNLPPDIERARASLYSRTRSMYAVADEMSAIPISAAQLRASPMQLGDKPLIVLTRGMKEASPFSKPEEAERVEQAWREFQSDLARRSSKGKQIIAEKSGHYIQFYQPELVIDTIRQIVEATHRQ